MFRNVVHTSNQTLSRARNRMDTQDLKRKTSHALVSVYVCMRGELHTKERIYTNRYTELKSYKNKHGEQRTSACHVVHSVNDLNIEQST